MVQHKSEGNMLYRLSMKAESGGVKWNALVRENEQGRGEDRLRTNTVSQAESRKSQDKVAVGWYFYAKISGQGGVA